MNRETTGVIPETSPRLKRELKTLTIMIRQYCHHHHGDAGSVSDLCSECEQLQQYAFQRIENCPFLKNEIAEDGRKWQNSRQTGKHPSHSAVEKPPCNSCPVHCYHPQQREKIRRIMRWSGPRMLWWHPWLTLLHFRSGRAFRRPY